MINEPQQRLELFRQRAQEMLMLAHQAPTDATRSSYFELAATWTQLAQELEAPSRWRRVQR